MTRISGVDADSASGSVTGSVMGSVIGQLRNWCGFGCRGGRQYLWCRGGRIGNDHRRLFRLRFGRRGLRDGFGLPGLCRRGFRKWNGGIYSGFRRDLDLGQGRKIGRGIPPQGHVGLVGQDRHRWCLRRLEHRGFQRRRFGRKRFCDPGAASVSGAVFSGDDGCKGASVATTAISGNGADSAWGAAITGASTAIDTTGGAESDASATGASAAPSPGAEGRSSERSGAGSGRAMTTGFSDSVGSGSGGGKAPSAIWLSSAGVRSRQSATCEASAKTIIPMSPPQRLPAIIPRNTCSSPCSAWFRQGPSASFHARWCLDPFGSLRPCIARASKRGYPQMRKQVRLCCY